MVEVVGVENLCNLINSLVLQGYSMVCVGTYIRSDDRAALEICGKVSELNKSVQTIVCEYGLENCVHELKEKRLRRIAIFDAVVVSEFVEGVLILGLDEVRDALQTISSHYIPIDDVVEYLGRELGGLEVVVIGIPVKSLELGLDMSPEVQKLVDRITSCFAEAGR